MLTIIIMMMLTMLIMTKANTNTTNGDKIKRAVLPSIIRYRRIFAAARKDTLGYALLDSGLVSCLYCYYSVYEQFVSGLVTNYLLLKEAKARATSYFQLTSSWPRQLLPDQACGFRTVDLQCMWIYWVCKLQRELQQQFYLVRTSIQLFPFNESFLFLIERG